MDNELKTEELIFNAAREVFLEKGFDGARMQEIAERAGINKALLHYYYRSKDKLFDMIFAQVIKLIFKQIESVWVSEISFEDKIRHFVSSYITLIVKNPYIPRFIINTINSYPDKFEQIIEEKSSGAFSLLKEKVNQIQIQIDIEIKKGNIINISAKDLLINIISLTIFPVVAGPMLKAILQIDKDDFKNMLEVRKKSVAEFILCSIRVK